MFLTKEMLNWIFEALLVDNWEKEYDHQLNIINNHAYNKISKQELLYRDFMGFSTLYKAIFWFFLKG